MLLICELAVDFNFFTVNPQKFAVRKPVHKSANQNLESAICGLADRFAEVPSTGLKALKMHTAKCNIAET